MVGVLDGHADGNGGRAVGIGINSSNFSKPCSVQGDSFGVLDRMQNDGNVTNCNSDHGEQICHEAHSDFSPNIGVQSSCGFNKIANGSAATQFYSRSGNRADEGFVDTDGMELEGGGEAAAAF